MAKTAYQRHHTKRLQNKWKKLHKHIEFIPESSLSFGKIFKQDPLDCGNPKCSICSYSKLYSKREKFNVNEIEDGNFLL